MYTNILLLLMLFLLIGFVAGRAQDRLLFLKAGVKFFCIELTAGLSLSVCASIVLAIDALLDVQLSVLTFCIFTIFLGSTMNFYIVRYLNIFKYSNDLLTMQVEYYIQWTTIFLTLYQFMTGSPANLRALAKLGVANKGLDVNIINLIILPLLLVSWISIAMIKIYLTDNEKGTPHNEHSS